MKLVIVESPAKAKTIAKYLGEGYVVDASGGHISDLPEKELGVDTEHGYEPTYVISEKKKDTVKRLTSEVRKAEMIYLATDPDREGEAISWHLQNALKLNKNDKNRIVFNEITKKAVNEAMLHPREVNMDLVDAQQARRVLDRLVGYKLSPVLCRKIQPKLSAGRVQSAALKIIVDREREIKAFVPKVYYTITAYLYSEEKRGLIFKGVLSEKNGKKFKISDEKTCFEVLEAVRKGKFEVDEIKRGKSFSSPPPPFTTSTLQQDAVSKLGLSSRTTMQIAQQLYEGVDIPGEGHTALVTYIRTDSVRVADEAMAAAKAYILEKYGEKYVPAKYNIYKSKKDIQDAHEAIRPINPERDPKSLEGKITRDQYRVYKLIYERFLASQSTKAEYDTLTVMTKNGEYGFRSTGRTMLFDGYLRIYGENRSKKESEEDENAKMPNLREGEVLGAEKVEHERKETKPPQRYTESTLVKTLEENGIGRPSTYATILSTLYARNYAVIEKKYIVPEELGFRVTEYLEEYFDDIVNAEFTAEMESKLDDIEEKGADWRKIIDDFYIPFTKRISTASQSRKMSYSEPSDEICEKCGAPMVIKEGRYGKYLACSAYPACSNIRSLKKEEILSGEVCEKCGKPMAVKTGKYGKFLACTGYPECRNIRPYKAAEEAADGKAEDIPTEEICEKCGRPMVEKIGRYGKYLACSGYPECKNIRSLKKKDAVDEITDEKCEKCGRPMVVKNGRYGKFLACSGYPECKNIRKYVSKDGESGKDANENDGSEKR